MHGCGMSQKRKVFMTMGKWGQTRILTFLFVSLLGPALAWSQVLTLTPSLTIGERYDDNIFQRETNEVDDFITTISPAIQLRYIPRPESVFTFEYQPAFEIFADNSDENHVSHRLSLSLDAPLSRRFSLEVSDQLLITEEPGDRDSNPLNPDDPIESDPSDSDERRQRSIRNTANLSLNVGLTPRTSLGLLFENLIEDVEDNDELDEFRYVIGSEVGYITNVARQNRAALTYRVSFFTFSQNCSMQEDTAGDCNRQDDESFTVHTVTVGYEHNLSATLTARAAFGYATTVSDDNEVDGNNAVVGSVGFAKTLRTGQVAFNYERSFTSGGGTADEVVSDRFFGSLTFRPSPKVTAAFAGSVSLLNFTEDNPDPVRDDDRVFYTLRPSVAYQVLRYLTLRAAYNLAVSNFQQSVRSDRVDHRFSAGAVFAIRAGLLVDLTYQYRTRDFDSTMLENREDDDFTRNEVILSVTYRPTFRF